MDRLILVLKRAWSVTQNWVTLIPHSILTSLLPMPSLCLLYECLNLYWFFSSLWPWLAPSESLSEDPCSRKSGQVRRDLRSTQHVRSAIPPIASCGDVGGALHLSGSQILQLYKQIIKLTTSHESWAHVALSTKPNNY